MRSIVALLLVLVASCCHEKTPTCPTLPAKPVDPAPVVVVAPNAPCSVPDKPAKIMMHATPNADGLTASAPIEDYKALVLFLVAMQARDDAMSACLEGR